MLQINLLDEGSGGGRASRAKKAAVVSEAKPALGASSPTSVVGGGGSFLGAMVVMLAVLVVIVGEAALVWWGVQRVNQAKADRDAQVLQRNRAATEIDRKLADADQIREYRDLLANQLDVLRTLDPPDRILWCEKINMLADLLPENVFIQEIEVAEEIQMVETAQSKRARERWEKAKSAKRGKEPEVVKRPVVRYIFRITGLALGHGYSEQYENVLNFHRAMVGYQVTNAQGVEHRFMDGFSPNVDFEFVETTVFPDPNDAQIKQTKLQWVPVEPVNRFTFRLTTRQWGVEKRSTEDEPDEETEGSAGA